MGKCNLYLVAVALAVGSILTLAACAAPPPTPTPTPLPPTPTPTATPPPTPTPTPEWGIAYAALDPLFVGEPSDNKPLSLRLIRSDGSRLTALTGAMEHITNLTASPDGNRLLFRAFREDTDGDHHPGNFDLPHLYTVDIRTGEVFTLTSGTDSMELGQALAWSPDSLQIAFVSSEVDTPSSIAVGEFHWYLYVVNRDGTGKRRLTPQEGKIESVDWSPTGGQILFEQNGAIWTVHPDGSGLFKVADTPIEYYWRPYKAQPVWSPDGRQIAFAAPGVGEEQNADIFVVNANGSGLVNLTQDPSYDFQPAWSPDGQHIAFATTRHGQRDSAIYIMDTDGSNCRQVFHDTTWIARDPIWSPDSSLIIIVGMIRSWEEKLFITDLAGSSRLLSEEYIGDRPAWVLIPEH
jgi:Tol biopolymer transport system component